MWRTLSILLCILLLATLALWLRSYRTFDRYAFSRHPAGFHVIGSFQGRLVIMSLTSRWWFDEGFGSGNPGGSPDWPAHWLDIFPSDPAPSRFLGCELGRGAFQQPGTGMLYTPPALPPVDTFRSLAIPYWLITAILLIPTIFCAAQLRQRRRRQLNHCPTCSYDLRAHSPGQKCPECGTPIPLNHP